MKIIKLTNSIDNTNLFINANNIDCIYEEPDGYTTVITMYNGEYCCKESAEEVYRKIKEVEND